MNSGNMTEETNLSLEEDNLASIQAMLQRETQAYSIPDYFQDSELVAPRHRRKMAEWCLYLADFIGFSQESVEMAMNCLDRFATTAAGPLILGDTMLFERATLTALYVAIKCNEEELLSPEDVEYICRGKHLQEEITSMEKIMLMELEWNINPPSAMRYVHSFLGIIPMNAEKTELVTKVASSQIKFAIRDYEISRKGPFIIAHAAILNALALVDADENDCSRFKSIIARYVKASKVAEFKLRKDLLEGIPSELIPESAIPSELIPESTEKETADEHESPTSAMDRALSTVVQSALAAKSVPLLESTTSEG